MQRDGENFLPPPVTLSERNRSPRVAGRFLETEQEKPNADALRELEREAGLFFTTACGVSAEEPTAMGGW